MKFAALLSYKGTFYSGWQRQKNAKSIQATLEIVFTEILKEPIVLVGCGRTDAGVHAHHYICHFEVNRSWDFNLVFRLNKRLPNDIVVHNIVEVDPSFNAQFKAVSRRYHYYFHTDKNPFLHPFSTYVDQPIKHLDLVITALEMVKAQTDFRAFCKSPDLYNTTICNIIETGLYRDAEGKRNYFSFEANRFLRSMIRILVFRLLQVGCGKMTLGEFELFFVDKPTLSSNDIAFPQGLFLHNVTYNSSLFNQPLHHPTNKEWLIIKQ